MMMSIVLYNQENKAMIQDWDHKLKFNHISYDIAYFRIVDKWR